MKYDCIYAQEVYLKPMQSTRLLLDLPTSSINIETKTLKYLAISTITNKIQPAIITSFEKVIFKASIPIKTNKNVFRSSSITAQKLDNTFLTLQKYTSRLRITNNYATNYHCQRLRYLNSSCNPRSYTNYS